MDLRKPMAAEKRAERGDEQKERDKLEGGCERRVYK